MSTLDISPATVAALSSATVADQREAPWRAALALAFAAALSGVLLTGVSVWFLGAVALAGLGPAAATFNFHFPAALVRLFALTRTVAKYGERLVGHRAALADQVRRRTLLFAAMALAPSVRAAGWQLGNQDRLADYMDDVEDVDTGRLRVNMPAASLVTVSAALAAATLALAPLALLPIAGLYLVAIFAIRWATPRIAGSRARARLAQRAAGRRLGSMLEAVVPLQAERAWEVGLRAPFGAFADAEDARLGERRTAAVLDTIVGLLGPFAALSVLAVAWHAGYRGGAMLTPAFLAFAWLALGEAALGLSRIVVGRVRARAAGEALDGWTQGATETSERQASLAAPPRGLSLRGLPLQTPDGRALGGSISATLSVGQPTAIVGASGAGKTTLLKQVAGWVGAESCGRVTSGTLRLDSATRRAMTHLGLHDAAILADTVRENLFAPQATDAECWDALRAVELDDRIRTAGGLDAWISQDVLSLGEAQRLNLARALLTSSPIVLLDEPTEHLRADQAERILARALLRLEDRIVAYVTHDRRAAALAAQTVSCDG